MTATQLQRDHMLSQLVLKRAEEWHLARGGMAIDKACDRLHEAIAIYLRETGQA